MSLRTCASSRRTIAKGTRKNLAIVFSLGKIADSAAAEALLRIEKAGNKDLKRDPSLLVQTVAEGIDDPGSHEELKRSRRLRP